MATREGQPHSGQRSHDRWLPASSGPVACGQRHGSHLRWWRQDTDCTDSDQGPDIHETCCASHQTSRSPTKRPLASLQATHSVKLGAAVQNWTVSEVRSFKHCLVRRSLDTVSSFRAQFQGTPRSAVWVANQWTLFTCPSRWTFELSRLPISASHVESEPQFGAGDGYFLPEIQGHFYLFLYRASFRK